MHMLLTTIPIASPWSKPCPLRKINHFCRKFKDSTALDHPCHSALTEIVGFKHFPGKFIVGVWTSSEGRGDLASPQTCHWVTAENVSWLRSHGCLHPLCVCPVSLGLVWEAVEGGWRVLKPGKVTRTAWLAATWTLSTEGSWWGSQRHNRPLFLAVGGWSVCYWVTHHSSHQLSSPRLLVGNSNHISRDLQGTSWGSLWLWVLRD